MIAISKEMKNKVVKTTVAGTAALGLLVGAGYAAWEASQGFKQDVNIADGVDLEYTVDGGTTWVDFDGTTANINLGLNDAWANFVPGQTNSTTFGEGQDAFALVQIRQVSTGADTARVELTDYTLTTTGAVFEGATPSTATVDMGQLATNNKMTAGVEYPLAINIAVPANLSTSYHGATGTITLTVEAETYTV